MRAWMFLPLFVLGCETEEQALLDGSLDDEASTLAVNEAPPPFTVTSTHPILGGKVTVSFEGANAGETVYILRGVNGTAPQGQCFPQAGGRCSALVAPVVAQTSIVASATGDGTRTVNFPNTPAYNGQNACFQAAILRGVGGAQSVFSTTFCSQMGYDADRDGIIDQLDQCAGFDDYFDWDMDGISDGCDAPADQPPVYTNATPAVNWTRSNFNGRPVQFYLPPNAQGVVMMFHGTGGDATIVESPEPTVILNELIARGYGFMSMSSDNRANGQWDLASRPTQNADWARITAWRTSKINSGEITANTPFYAWGFSNGGGFVGWLTNAAPANNFPLRAGTVQSSSGYNDYYGDPGNLPVQFIGARWDDVVPYADVQARYNTHVGRGYPGEYRLIPEGRIAPTRFDRSDFILPAKSLELFKVVVDEGWFDKGGRRLFPGPDIDGTVDVIGRSPNFIPAAPGKGVLNAVLATHAANAYYYLQIANFFDRY